MILGEPGSGKTVLVLELLVQMLEERRDRDAERTPDVVPVRFSLSAWNTDQPFSDWLSAQLVAHFGLLAATARALVRNERVLPVLDGLDEMDPEHQQPLRAEAAVRQLNEYVAGREGLPLVLTCRTNDYARVGDAVRPAVHVRIQPLTGEQITATCTAWCTPAIRTAPAGRSGRACWARWTTPATAAS
ncbi:NACHT domain-containing protein [Actinoplanes sp. NPDC049118]|uniref:NACHT domain-containing protein n=1 Tax=Actinoplanes sp. NPDC049118 TaxID=3155769 RepID=UPI0033D7C46A